MLEVLIDQCPMKGTSRILLAENGEAVAVVTLYQSLDTPQNRMAVKDFLETIGEVPKGLRLLE